MVFAKKNNNMHENKITQYGTFIKFEFYCKFVIK